MVSSKGGFLKSALLGSLKLTSLYFIFPKFTLVKTQTIISSEGA
jgi:hypothetical protein